MSSKNTKIAHDVTCVTEEFTKQLNLLYVCGFCTKLVGDDEDIHLKHALNHDKEISYCRTCCIPIKKCETDNHLKEIHPSTYRLIKMNVDRSLIELRIACGKSFSNFWGICLPPGDRKLDHFSSVIIRWWSNFKNGRSIGCFRVIKSKLHWRCPVCRDNKPLNVFNETISMRAYALAHLEQYHHEEMMINVGGFLEFEWHNLQEETDFDVKALMHIATHRSQTLQRSFLTFYTIDISLLENGEHFLTKLNKKDAPDYKTTRYCLICCCLIPIELIKSHFRKISHRYLEAVAESTAFVMVTEKQGKYSVEMEDIDGNDEENAAFEFPKELFTYTQVYKNLHRDEFKWRCCLCPKAPAQTFSTQIIMRMYALRHIDENHRIVFTEEFLAFEWLSIRHEMRASFDIRKFTPLDYTIKGEATFNSRDPNDYVLPQQYYFLTKEIVEDTVICGFCYRSLHRFNFLLHIAIHGFGLSEACDIRPVVLNDAVKDLMGQDSYSDEGLDSEPHNILTVDGKRLKAKMELINEQRARSTPCFSEFATTIKSERDTDGEGYTPRSRKSAMDARRLLTETFKVLQENVRNRKNTYNEMSSSSSSDDDNSDDERFEKALEMEATTRAERQAKSKSIDMKMKDVMSVNDNIEMAEAKESPKKVITKMKPAEIREWIREEAKKRGVPWKDSSDSSSSDSDSDSDEDKCDEKPKTRNKFDSMKPKDIKEMIHQAAKKNKITLPNDSSSSSSSSDSE